MHDDTTTADKKTRGQNPLRTTDSEEICSCCELPLTLLFQFQNATIAGPIPRSGHRIFSDGDYIYLVGGYNPKHDSQHTFTEVWRFNRLTEQWARCKTVEGLVPDCLASFSRESI